jgi:DNA repair protein RadC
MEGKIEQAEKVEAKKVRKSSGGGDAWKHTILKVYEPENRPAALTSPSSVAELIKGVLAAEGDSREQEHVWVLGLDSKNKLKMLQLGSLGGFAFAPVDPRVIFRALILNACTGFITCHNHPSNDPTPSREDMDLCEKIKKGADLLGYRMLDFVIVGNDGSFLSFAEAGYL